MSTRKLMHVDEIRGAMHAARIHAESYLMNRRPWWRPTLRMADRLAEAYHRGGVDMAERVLTGHKDGAGVQDGADGA